MITGCSDDNPVDNETIGQEDARYYVKYEMYMPIGGFTSQKTLRQITFVSENGEQILNTSNTKWGKWINNV